MVSTAKRKKVLLPNLGRKAMASNLLAMASNDLLAMASNLQEASGMV